MSVLCHPPAWRSPVILQECALTAAVTDAGGASPTVTPGSDQTPSLCFLTSTTARSQRISRCWPLCRTICARSASPVCCTPVQVGPEHVQAASQRLMATQSLLQKRVLLLPLNLQFHLSLDRSLVMSASLIVDGWSQWLTIGIAAETSRANGVQRTPPRHQNTRPTAYHATTHYGCSCTTWFPSLPRQGAALCSAVARAIVEHTGVPKSRYAAGISHLFVVHFSDCSSVPSSQTQSEIHCLCGWPLDLCVLATNHDVVSMRSFSGEATSSKPTRQHPLAGRKGGGLRSGRQGWGGDKGTFLLSPKRGERPAGRGGRRVCACLFAGHNHFTRSLFRCQC